MSAYLSSFTGDLQVAVIGASGGIGSAFVENLASCQSVKRVYAFSRNAIAFDHDKVSAGSIDITDEQSIEQAVQTVDGELDIILVTTGILHGNGLMPEKSLRDLSMTHMEQVFAVNVFGPTLVAQHFLPLIPRQRKSVFAALSARVGSIQDNRLGGWYSYRASKSALNMMIKNTAIETARRYKEACIIGLHPGTVDTSLSKPFQSNVKESKLFTPDHSAQCLLNLINGITANDSGKIFAWDGQEIPA